MAKGKAFGRLFMSGATLVGLGEAETGDADGIQVEVAGDLRNVLLVLDQDGLEASLEEVPRGAMSPVEANRIGQP